MSEVSFRDLQKGLRELGLTPQSRVIVHTSLSAFGRVRGGAETVVGALTSACQLVVMPTFTYQCLVQPRVGPPDNGMTYGDHFSANAEAEMFQPDLPAHPDMGVVAETLRRLPGAGRSSHPLLSFAAAGRGAELAMTAQSLAEPLGPVAHLAEHEGDVLLLGVGHSVNTAIHYAEYRAGRKQFIRWALTPRGVVECVAWPGDSAGFDAIIPHLRDSMRSTQIGQAHVQRVPLRDLLRVAEGLVRADSTALLCQLSGCERCEAIRAALANTPTPAAA